ncbi:MAG TPA: alpha/beta fold hydrolase [Verrucomicrobiae bacterium]|nr:alpha/beta fold hydrolase [Verrucomicrobiae bacterium]
MPLLAAPGVDDVTASGLQYVQLLSKGDFKSAVARSDATMKAALPEDKLKETWQALQSQVGSFQKPLQTRATRVGGFDVALVTCQFERARLDVKVVFNANRQVAGLFFMPNTTDGAAAAPPPYAPTNSFRETNFTVGQSPRALPGTLTLPVRQAGGKLPVVLLIHGSGPNDRDETVGAIKPFRDLAWGLAAKGIAVLRYEKRTKEYAVKLAEQGIGKFTVQQETIEDALSAVRQLRSTHGLDPNRIFVLGHSLGGTVAPRIAQADRSIAGLIILAGSTRPLEDLIVEQTRYLVSLSGEPSAAEKARLAAVQEAAAKVKKLSASDSASQETLLGAPASYWLDLRAHDPVAIAKSLPLPCLILQGGRDYQVTRADFDGWKAGLASKPTVTFKLYPALNHLFVAGEGKSTPAEYEKPGNLDATVIADIAAWVLRSPN